MTDETLHAISIAWLSTIVGIIAGAYFGIADALAAIVSVTAVIVAAIVAGAELGDDTNEG